MSDTLILVTTDGTVTVQNTTASVEVISPSAGTVSVTSPATPASVTVATTGVPGPPGPGVPTGGTGGQSLAKIDATDFNTQWVTLPTGHIIQEEGVDVAQRAYLNFVGTGVAVTDNGVDKTVVTIEGGGVSDHGGLTGLGDDDHTLYALADGTRGAFASTTHDHDLDYDALGAATSAVSAHELAADPHSQYLTVTEGNAAYSLTTHNHTGVYDPAGTASSAVSAHEGASDPHTIYQKEAEKNAVNGYAGLDASTKIAFSQIPTGTSNTTVSIGDHAHSGVYEPAGTVATHAATAGHELLSSTTPAALTPDITGAVGTGTTTARADHVHAITTDVAVALGASNAEGNSTSFARANHVHIYPTAANVGADPAGTASSAVSTHAGLADPHTVYQLESQKGAANGYASLDGTTKLPIAQVPTGTTGTTVSLGDHLHGGVYDPAGTAASAVSVHEGASNPHPIYLTQTEGDAIYATGTHNHDAAYLSPSEILAGTNVSLDTTTTPGSVIISATATGGTTDHGALTGLADDDHPQYQKESEKGAASGYASLDASTKIPIAEVPTGTTVTTVSLGNHAHAGVYDPAGTAASAVSTHAGEADPHTGYQKETEKNAANGYAGLDAGTKVVIGQIPTGTTGTTVSLGNHSHSGYALTTTSLTAGAGLTGGGDLSTGRTFTVGAGTGITVNADDIQINRTVVDTWYSASGHNHDHGALTGLADDDHTQYGIIVVSATEPVSPRVGTVWVPAG